MKRSSSAFAVVFLVLSLSTACSGAGSAGGEAAQVSSGPKAYSDVKLVPPSGGPELKSGGTERRTNSGPARKPVQRYVLKTVSIDGGSAFVSIPQGHSFSKSSRTMQFKELGSLPFTVLHQADDNILLGVMIAGAPAGFAGDPAAAQSIAGQYLAGLKHTPQNVKRRTGTVQGVPAVTLEFDAANRHSIAKVVLAAGKLYIVRSDITSAAYRDVAADYVSSFRLAVSGEAPSAAPGNPRSSSTAPKARPRGSKSPPKQRRLER